MNHSPCVHQHPKENERKKKKLTCRLGFCTQCFVLVVFCVCFLSCFHVIICKKIQQRRITTTTTTHTHKKKKKKKKEEEAEQSSGDTRRCFKIILEDNSCLRTIPKACAGFSLLNHNCHANISTRNSDTPIK